MRIQSKLRIILALAVGFVSIGLHAATDTSTNADNSAGKTFDNSYSSQSAGVAFLQNITIHGGGLIQWKPGPKVELSNGGVITIKTGNTTITDRIFAEFQYGFAYNGMSKVDGQSVSSGDIWTVPLMLNGIYKYPLNDHWRLYGGLGGGAIISVLNTPSPSGQNYTDCVFGYQAMLGVQYHFNDKCVFGLGYGFLCSLDHHFNTTTSPTYMHSIMLTFSSTW